jgi:hypothetical protein
LLGCERVERGHGLPQCGQAKVAQSTLSLVFGESQPNLHRAALQRYGRRVGDARLEIVDPDEHLVNDFIRQGQRTAGPSPEARLAARTERSAPIPAELEPCSAARTPSLINRLR